MNFSGHSVLRSSLVVACLLTLVLVSLAGCGGSSAAKKAKPTLTPAQRSARAEARRRAQVRAYALALLPNLRRSARAFACAATFASSHSSGDVNAACAPHDVNLAASNVDGVPHPYNWYTTVGTLHHQIMGVFHDMQGAIVAWQTATESDDPGGRSSAVSDMVHAQQELAGVTSQVTQLARTG